MTLLILILALISYGGNMNSADGDTLVNDKLLLAVQKIDATSSINGKSHVLKATLPTHSYESTTIDGFFKELVSVHEKHFAEIYDSNFLGMCEMNKLNPANRQTKNDYYTLLILHKLFTAQTPSDYSRGEILNIPYMWHWTDPNPRHSIQLTVDGSYLKDHKPPSKFKKYNSFADIDRIPSLYLTDFMADQPKYMSEEGGTFSTFGWCSEREMSFVSLLAILDYEAKVIVDGAHSWTECLVTIQSTGEPQVFVVKIDNTYDEIYWIAVDTEEVAAWRAKRNETSTGRWYDRTAHSESELDVLKKIDVGAAVADRIEEGVVEFLNSRGK